MILSISINRAVIEKVSIFIERHTSIFILFLLTAISAFYFLFYYSNGLGLAYNDARSHLDIGRRVVEGLKPGLAQLGSVWLPLPHLLMVPTIWNDFMWHSGLSGALQSMISFVATGLLIYFFLEKIGVRFLGRFIGVVVFTANINVLYLQSTAMTELLLIATMLAGVYELMLYFKDDEAPRTKAARYQSGIPPKPTPLRQGYGGVPLAPLSSDQALRYSAKGNKILSLIKSSFWIMLSSRIRYEGWFLLAIAGGLIIIKTLKSRGYKVSEGVFLFFCTLAGFGVVLWFLWNQLIFKDALYFVFGPYSARSQQAALEEAGVLATKGDLLFSLKIYLYALVYNSYAFNVILGLIGASVFWFDKNIKTGIKIASVALFAPLIFNVLALYLGHSVLFIQGLSGNTWFNARYGIMMLPTIAIFIGYLIHKAGNLRYVIIGLFIFVTYFAFANYDAVTIDDARVGSSQKNVTEVSGWLNKNAKDKEGFILIAAASHDAIIFSSGLPMSRFIHEGTGAYWESATVYPDRWARWIVMRTNDLNDGVFKTVSKTPGIKQYDLVGKYPFADIYEIKEEFVSGLNTEPILGKQR